MKMKTLFCALAFIALSTQTAAAIDTAIGDVKDTRTTGKFFAGLEVELKLIGDGVDSIKGIRTNLATVSDDTGKDLIDPEKVKKEFEEFNQFGHGQNSVTLRLKNPSRKAAKITKLDGSLELFLPSKDPQANVTVAKLKSLLGKPLESPALKAAGIELTVLDKAANDKQKAAEKEKAATDPKQMMGQMFGSFMSVNENDLVFKINDPKKKLVSYQLQDTSGKKISNNGSMFTDNTKIINYSSPLPDDAQLAIFILTDKALVKIPLKMDAIALP